MLKKIMAAMLSVICFSFTAYAAYADVGFDEEWGDMTSTANEYFFETDDTLVVRNKEVIDDPQYDELVPGDDIYIPVHVYPDRGKQAVPATDKMMKTDNLSVSSKVLSGKSYVGDVDLVSGKKLKLKGVAAGIYTHIPITSDYTKTGWSSVSVSVVLSVNDVTYDDTQVTLKCHIRNRVTEIDKNSVYGAKTPAQFKAANRYSGEATFDFGNKIKYTARVKSGKTYYLNLSKTPDPALQEMYPDAYLEFYSFLGNLDTFQTTGALEIPITRSKLSEKGAAPSLYVYRTDGKKLTALGEGVVSFNSKTDKLTINTKTLDSYVLSNRPLLKEISAVQNNNILKSGYADISYSESSQIPGTAASTSAYQTAPALAELSASTSADSAVSSAGDDDGYVPEESVGTPVNDNLSMGLAINAENRSSDNPSTSDSGMLPAAFAGIACGLTALIFLRKTM